MGRVMPSRLQQIWPGSTGGCQPLVRQRCCLQPPPGCQQWGTVAPSRPAAAPGATGAMTAGHRAMSWSGSSSQSGQPPPVSLPSGRQRALKQHRQQQQQLRLAAPAPATAGPPQLRRWQRSSGSRRQRPDSMPWRRRSASCACSGATPRCGKLLPVDGLALPASYLMLSCSRHGQLQSRATLCAQTLSSAICMPQALQHSTAPPRTAAAAICSAVKHGRPPLGHGPEHLLLSQLAGLPGSSSRSSPTKG